MIFEKSTISKFIHGYKFLKAKNGDNLVDKELLLFTTNSAISNLSAQSSC